MRHGLALLIVTAIAASVTASAALAQTYTVYECAFVIRGTGGEQTNMLIALDKSGGAFTYDTPPGAENPVRMPVTARNDGPGHVIYTYTFNMPHADTGTVRVDLQARIPREGGKSRMSMRGRGYSGRPSGDGTCTMKKNMQLPY